MRNMTNRFPSCKQYVLDFYCTGIRVMRYRIAIALDFKFYLVSIFCIWPNHFVINMKSSRGDNCFKTVNHFVLLLWFALLWQHVSYEQCFLIGVRFDVWLCTLSIVVFIALAFALNKILKSYTLQIFMLCNIFMFWFLELLSQQQIMLAKQMLIWQKKRLRKNQLQDSSTKMYQRKSGRKSRDTPNQYSIDQYSKIYPKYDLKSTSVNTWKTKCKSNKENTLIKKSETPNLLSDELLWKTKDIIGKRSAGTII